MGLFSRIKNPIWHKATSLPYDRQRTFAIILSMYEVSRDQIQENLISPLLLKLQEGNFHLDGFPTNFGPSHLEIESLIDEALLGVLRSCKTPADHTNHKLALLTPRDLPEILGIFALADSNNRLRRSSPTTLDQTVYSIYPDEARTQVLVRCMNILHIPDATFAQQANLQGFPDAWDRCIEFMISGLLKGISRVEDHIIIAKGKTLAASIPSHRRPVVEYLIHRMQNS